MTISSNTDASVYYIAVVTICILGLIRRKEQLKCKSSLTAARARATVQINGTCLADNNNDDDDENQDGGCARVRL